VRVVDLVAASLVGQTRHLSRHPISTEPSTDEVVTELRHMQIDGISDELMISYIRSRGHAYQLTAEQVIRLKDGGVDDVVIKALMGDNVASPAPQPSRTQVATVPASLSIRPEATAQPEPQGPATVHIYRTGSHGNAIKVMIDRQEAFKVSNHELMTFQLCAGPHEIAAPYADRKPMVEINLRPGKEYFFELAFKVRRAGAVFGIVDPADAIGLELIRQPAIIDPARVHERLLPADQLAWISSLHSPVPDP
jgi:hypothetical protein